MTSSVPELSGSLDSLNDEEAIEFDSEDNNASTLSVRPRILRQDSGASNRSRGFERHIGPSDLEKMVITIKQTSPATIKSQGPLAIPALQTAQQQDPTPCPIPTVDPIVHKDEQVASSASSKLESSECSSGGSERSTTSIVRGFSQGVISNSYRQTPLPELTTESAPKPTDITPRNNDRQKPAMFALGGSSGDSYTGSSMDERHQPVQPKKKPVFAFGASSGEDESSFRDSLPQKSSLVSSRNSNQDKKQTSFLEEVEERRIGDDNVFEETDDEDDIDESAIDDDDDSSDWEDSLDENSGKSSIDEKTFFQRVDSRPNLVSRRSMLTTLLHQGDRAAALSNVASKSTPALYRSRTTTPNGPSLAASPDSDDASPLMMKKGNKSPQAVQHTTPQPIIMTTTNNTSHQVALSPKSTRRNMLATELTASLRRNLLWERQQKNSTAMAVLKRRSTALGNLKDIKEYPERAHMDKNIKETSFNEYFGQGLGEYHSKGW